MELSVFLDKLNLNSYEKEAILFLSSVDKSTAGEIVKNTKIPWGRIYSVLAELNKKGIIKTLPTKPKTFKIDDVKKVLRNYLEIRKSDIEEKIQKVGSIKKTLKRLDRKRERVSVSFLKGREEHLSKVIEMRDNSSKEMIQIAPSFSGSFSTMLSMRRALSRGVKVRVLIRKFADNNRKNVMNTIKYGGEVREKDEGLFTMLISDNSDIIFGVHDYLHGEERVLIESRSERLLNVFKNFFEDIWKEAKPVKL